MNDKETDEFVDMLSFIAEEEAKVLTHEETVRMIIHGCKGWIDFPIERVRERYAQLKGESAQ
tara:strand:- start:3 stop:188 length:186 start_codon:yes stop_codon:yes gene_type:complete